MSVPVKWWAIHWFRVSNNLCRSMKLAIHYFVSGFTMQSVLSKSKYPHRKSNWFISHLLCKILHSPFLDISTSNTNLLRGIVFSSQTSPQMFGTRSFNKGDYPNFKCTMMSSTPFSSIFYVFPHFSVSLEQPKQRRLFAFVEKKSSFYVFSRLTYSCFRILHPSFFSLYKNQLIIYSRRDNVFQHFEQWHFNLVSKL